MPWSTQSSSFNLTLTFNSAFFFPVKIIGLGGGGVWEGWKRFGGEGLGGEDEGEAAAGIFKKIVELKKKRQVCLKLKLLRD